MSKSDEKALIGITQRLDKLENRIFSKAFLKEIVDSITNIELCANCGIVVMATFGNREWTRKGFYQSGSINNKIASWCSEECEKEKV